MDAQTYPGKGLSLSQLVFALNEELRRVSYSPCFTIGTISQLYRDTMAALATIRAWKNSLVTINRIPEDILSLIPTHLPPKDRLRTSHVCQHWRRVFLRSATLWSQIHLTKNGDYVKLFLERAKGCGLKINSPYPLAPQSVIKLLSPHAQRIESLALGPAYCQEIRGFSEANPGPLPLLRSLFISEFDSHRRFDTGPLFSGAINLDTFGAKTQSLRVLSHFVFPNLTTFTLSAALAGYQNNASHLVDFLKVSPALRTVEIEIIGDITFNYVAQETVLILPNVKSFSLKVEGDPIVYGLAACISCPCAESTSLVQKVDPENFLSLDIFPTPGLWNAIAHQYSKRPAEGTVFTLEIKLKQLKFRDTVMSSIGIRSSDTSVVDFGFQVYDAGVGADPDDLHFEYFALDAFSRTLSVARRHPQLLNVKRLHIEYHSELLDTQMPVMLSEFGELFTQLGPLEEIILQNCDLYLVLCCFFDITEPRLPRMDKFKPTKKLTILHPSTAAYEAGMGVVVEFVKSQYTLGKPFERVTIRATTLPAGMAEELGKWVDVVDYREEAYV